MVWRAPTRRSEIHSAAWAGEHGQALVGPVRVSAESGTGYKQGAEATASGGCSSVALGASADESARDG